MCRAGLALIPLLFMLSCGDGSPAAPSSPTPTSTVRATSTPTAPAAVTHLLTMTASPSCTALPDGAKRRTYPAQLQEKAGGELLVLVVNSYDIMIGWGPSEAGFTGTRDGNRVTFDITDKILEGVPYAMIERIDGVGDMGFFGTATGTIDNGRITATFDGQYRLGYGSSGRVLCEAPDHLIEVTRVDR
jgi:hypothetical protein